MTETRTHTYSQPNIQTLEPVTILTLAKAVKPAGLRQKSDERFELHSRLVTISGTLGDTGKQLYFRSDRWPVLNTHP